MIGSTGNKYTVTQSADGKWSCTCKSYEFGKGKDCKHIVMVKESQPVPELSTIISEIWREGQSAAH